jgi:hypothetical protein
MRPSALRCPASRRAAKQVGGAPPGEQLSTGGPVPIRKDGGWEGVMRSIVSEDYHYIFVCRKRGGA